MIRRRVSLAFVCLTLICSAVPAFSQQAGQPSYESLLEKVKKSDPAADFAALRYAHFDKEGDVGTDRDISREMFAAFRDKKYEKAIEQAQKILKSNFVSIDAHMVLAASYKDKNEPEKAKFHHYVASGLIKSILNSGDGKSMETAFVVISTDEEYVILRILGLMSGSQSLLSKDGHHYDQLDAIDMETKKPVTLYFNIDRPFGALEKLFKK